MIADHNDEKLAPLTLNTVSAAQKIGHPITCLVAGTKVATVVEQLKQVEGVTKVLTIENDVFKGQLAEVLASVVLEAQKKFNFTHILTGASSVGKVR